MKTFSEGGREVLEIGPEDEGHEVADEVARNRTKGSNEHVKKLQSIERLNDEIRKELKVDYYTYIDSGAEMRYKSKGRENPKIVSGDDYCKVIEELISFKKETTKRKKQRFLNRFKRSDN